MTHTGSFDIRWSELSDETRRRFTELITSSPQGIPYVDITFTRVRLAPPEVTSELVEDLVDGRVVSSRLESIISIEVHAENLIVKEHEA